MALALKGTPNSAMSISVTIPTHAVGDLIVIWAVGATAIPTVPGASGTVPAWVTIDSTTSGAIGMIDVYFVATATNHTSGTWTGATGMIAVVVSGQDAVSFLGGHACASAANSATTATAPSVTLSKTDGSSLILEFFGARLVTAIGSPSAGYTQQASNFTGSSVGVVFDTKDSSTSDGSVTHSVTQSLSNNNGGATVEILASAAAGQFFAMF